MTTARTQFALLSRMPHWLMAALLLAMRLSARQCRVFAATADEVWRLGDVLKSKHRRKEFICD